MKKLTLLFIFLSTSILSAQDITDWQIGVNVNPFYFTRIKDNFYYEKDKQNKPNGVGFGISIEKNWNEHWGIKTSIDFCNQNQKYISETQGYPQYLSMSFKYYKIPLNIQYTHQINNKLFFVFNQGLQVSFLNDFLVIRENKYQKGTLTPNYSEELNYDGSFYLSSHRDYSQTFNNTLYGVVGSIGSKYFISNRLSFSINIKYEYDFSDADILYSTSSNLIKDEFNEAYNLRIGIELGIQYHFEINDIFDKSPIKL